jgi:uncharacterized repeat protein (TIGR01451 family)
MRTMMRTTAAVGVLIVAAMTVGTLSTLAARAGALPTMPTDASASASGAGVRIEVSDDTRSAHSGEVIDYTVRVDNESATSYPALDVYHMVPAGFQLVDSSPHATQEGSTLRWTANVPAGHTVVFTDQVVAGTVEESEHLAPLTRDAKRATEPHQFTSTACARTSSAGEALVCGTVREQLTDGPDAAAGVTAPAPKHWQPGLLWVALIAALYTAFRSVLRKRKGHSEDE